MLGSAQSAGYDSARPVSGSNPPLSTYEEKVLQWMTLGLQEGISINKREYHYDQIGAAIDAIMGADEPVVRSPKLSRIKFNRLQKIALELRSMMTDIKPFWTYEANCKRYEPQAKIFGKLARNWYQRQGIDQVFRDAIDYVLAAGTGYIHLYWDPDLPGPSDAQGRQLQGDIAACAEDPRDVVPFSMSGDKRSLQKCKGVFIRRERPTRYLREIHAGRGGERIKSDRIGFEKESPSSRRSREAQEAVLDSSSGLLFGPGSFFGQAPARKLGGSVPVTDEFTVYLHDFTRLGMNEEPKEMGPWIDAVDEMGQPTRQPAASWSYIVQPGDMLYPFGRRIVATRYGILEDGPSHFQHGMFPICKVTLDTWAWSWLGTSPIHSLIPIQREINETIRSIADNVRRSANRGFVYDKKAIPPGVAKKFNTRAPNQRLGINPHAAGPKGAFQIVEEPEISKTIPEWLQLLMDEMEEESGVASLKAFTQLGQVPSTETIDKIIDSMTPLVRARSRAMETFIREFAMMLASMFMQFYDVNLRLRILGAEGMTQEDWDYRPGDLLPDYIDDDDYGSVFGPDGTVSYFIKESAQSRGPKPDYIRNREFLRFFDFNVEPGSLLDAATVTKKLLHMQLWRMGLLDRWTLLETLGVPNGGKPPAWATTLDKRVQAERLIAMTGGFPMPGEGAAGRPPTGDSMPTLNETDGGMETTSN